MRSFSVLAAAAVFSVSAYTAPVVPAFEADDPPELTAEAWILYDADADVVLAAKNANDERPMASVTKIMTALVVMAISSMLSMRASICTRSSTPFLTSGSPPVNRILPMPARAAAFAISVICS